MAAMGNLLKDIRKGREDRSLYLRGILPYLFALGCARAWVTLAVAAPALALPAAFDLHDVFDYAFCLVSIAAALAARLLLPLNATGRMRAASAALMVAASLCTSRSAPAWSQGRRPLRWWPRARRREARASASSCFCGPRS